MFAGVLSMPQNITDWKILENSNNKNMLQDDKKDAGLTFKDVSKIIWIPSN